MSSAPQQQQPCAQSAQSACSLVLRVLTQWCQNWPQQHNNWDMTQAQTTRCAPTTCMYNAELMCTCVSISSRLASWRSSLPHRSCSLLAARRSTLRRKSCRMCRPDLSDTETVLSIEPKPAGSAPPRAWWYPAPFVVPAHNCMPVRAGIDGLTGTLLSLLVPAQYCVPVSLFTVNFRQ